MAEREWIPDGAALYESAQVLTQPEIDDLIVQGTLYGIKAIGDTYWRMLKSLATP